ncbi:fimbrial-like adhesin protein [Escherichia coli]|uniref:Fimbrial-like adhesin protein n=1 Tax=Escherichia coli TaxID=562 RepID=A0A376U2L1_ECOLX|nr:fimbrial-like adhesin protein [Escherichia coli]
MHPTQRKLMKRIILFLSLQFPITYPAIAGQDIDLVANVKNSTCKSGISNQGNIDLGVVGVDIFQIMLLLKAINQVEKSSLSQYQTVHYRELAMCLISYILILEPLAVSWLQVQGKYLPMKSQPGLKMSVSFSFPFRTRPIYSMLLVQQEILVPCIQ